MHSSYILLASALLGANISSVLSFRVATGGLVIPKFAGSFNHGANKRPRTVNRGLAMNAGIDSDLLIQLAGCSSVVLCGNFIEKSYSHGKSAPPSFADEVERSSQEIDIFRDSPLRYLGYTNEIGEALRPIVPHFLVLGSYSIAIFYVLADTVSKTKETLATATVGDGTSANPPSPSPAAVAVAQSAATTAIDVLLFQLMASVVLPGFTINRFVHFSEEVLNLYVLPYIQQLSLMATTTAATATTTGSSIDSAVFTGGMVRPLYTFLDIFPANAAVASDIGATATTTATATATALPSFVQAALPATYNLLLHWGPTMCGLLLIPFIVKPLDAFVEFALDKTTRPAFQKWMDNAGSE